MSTYLFSCFPTSDAATFAYLFSPPVQLTFTDIIHGHKRKSNITTKSTIVVKCSILIFEPSVPMRL